MIISCTHCQITFTTHVITRKFCSVSCSNRHHRNKLRSVKLPRYSKNLAEFIGILLGDGYVSRYQVAVTLNTSADREYIIYIINLIKQLFPQATISIITRKDNATDIRINSTIVARFFHNMGIIPRAKGIPAWIKNNKSYTLSCVRGLIDTEGSISYKIYSHKAGISVYKQLNFRGTDKEVMQFVRDALVTIGLHPTRTLKTSLYISNKPAIERYRSRIGFGNPKLLKRSAIYTFQQYQLLNFP